VYSSGGFSAGFAQALRRGLRASTVGAIVNSIVPKANSNGVGQLILRASSSAARREAARPLAALVSQARLGWNGIRLLVSHAGRGDTLDKDRYAAFVSYRHLEPDRGWAIWVHGALELYVVPRALRRKPDAWRIGRVFRDEEELAASPHLSEDIRGALRQSEWLIVVCSPRSKGSEWVDAEIRYFRELGRGDRILALLIEGDPGTAFPASLYEIRQPLSGDGVLNTDEPLAADVRPDRERSARKARRLAKLQLLAPILGRRFDDLRDREQKRRFRRTIAGVTAGLVGLAVVGSLVFFLEASRKEAAQRTADAERKAAEAINNDLDLKPDEFLTRRQSQTLWKLTAADESIKRDYVSILASSPEETIRASPGLAQISRALGFLEANRTLDLVLKQFDQTKDPVALQALASTLQTLAPKLSEAQASQALDPVLKLMGQTNDLVALQWLAEALQALPVSLSEAQASQALDPLLKLIGQTTDLWRLSRAIQTVAPKLSAAQANKAIDLVLKMIGQMIGQTDSRDRATWAEALPALAHKLSQAQASKALDPVLKWIGQTTDSGELARLAEAFQALAPKVTETQMGQGLDLILKRIGQTTDSFELSVLAQALQALAPKLSQAQAGKALDTVLTQIAPDDRSGGVGLKELVEALRVLPVSLSEAQASQALDSVLKVIGQPDVGARMGAMALQTLAPKLSEAQASQALDPVLKQFDQMTDPIMLQMLAKALQALPVSLSEVQVNQALDHVLTQIKETTDSGELLMLAPALPALVTKLSQTQASTALDPVLTLIDQTTNPHALQSLAEALHALPVSLSEAQASKALDTVLTQVGQTTDSSELQTLAEALQALAPKLTTDQARKTTSAAASSLAWGASDAEAKNWGRALVKLSDRSKNREMLVTAIAYPAAAGSATEVLLDAIREGHSDAPAKEKGTTAALEWLAKTFPDVLRPPLCPEPLQPGLKCPSSARQQN
jgi:ribosomal protein S7